jgi:hypothetical protein
MTRKSIFELSMEPPEDAPRGQGGRPIKGSYPTLTLDRLNTIMNKGGIDDHSIMQGIELRHVGYQKLARIMGVTVKEISQMINELIVKLRADQKLMAEEYDSLLDEDTDDKFTYEKDFLGNMTLRDSETGDEVYLQGTTAAELSRALSGDLDHADKQELLAHYMDNSHAEGITEEDEPQEKSYEPEIDGGRGTYNFPWKLKNLHGTATVEYSASGGKPVIDLVSVRDASGDEMDTNPAFEAALKQQAVAFIGDA